MRRQLPSFIVILIGVGLIVYYLVIRNGLMNNEHGVNGSQPTATQSIFDLANEGVASTVDVPPSITVAPTPIASATQTPQPIIPTRTIESDIARDDTGSELLSPTMSNFSLSITEIRPCQLSHCLLRTGVSGSMDDIREARDAGLPFGHYLTWRIEKAPGDLSDATFWQMVPINEAGLLIPWEDLGKAVDEQPGAIWIVGNEPDIIWQGNTSAERYAQIYSEVYSFIKGRDPEAILAIAGVGQPTPMRLAYLDEVLRAYHDNYGETLPVDIWTMHAFVLREERDSWGVGIPPGVTADHGKLYEVKDHNNLMFFRDNLLNFRSWMKDRGYRDKPLAITEYGILHPADYGFPPDIVADFMIGAFDFFADATDDEIGYPADQNRLFQWWFWYSVFDSGDYPTGNLYDPDTRELTDLGRVFARLVDGGQ